MFDTPVTVVGNVLTAPEWRRTSTTGAFVVTFKVASTSRRFDKERALWVDGASLRVRVTCWRRLGENVSVSVQLGDPVIVHGRLYSRDWVDEQGTKRTSYELDAVAVGHDLNRGVDKFARRRPAGATDMVNDAANAMVAGGEPTEPMDGPGRPDDLPPDHELFEEFDSTVYDTAPILPAGTAEEESLASAGG
jgi:single-strand DNA-binding protein